MKRLWKAAVAATGLALLAGPVLAASPAGCDTADRLWLRQHVARHRRRWFGHDVPRAGRPEQRVERVRRRTAACSSPRWAPVSGTASRRGSPETNTLVNYQHDNVSQAPDVGSSAGVQALNGVVGAGGDYGYSGTVRTMPAGEVNVGAATGILPDFARSSRGPRTSGSTGSAPTGNELDSDTFWGFAQDGLEVTDVQQPRGAQVQARAGAGAITANELYHIWNCDYTTWSQIAVARHRCRECHGRSDRRVGHERQRRYVRHVQHVPHQQRWRAGRVPRRTPVRA